MASLLQQTVSGIVLNNYVSLVVITAVGYDYILTFSDEIKYIWSKPWTRVSTLFVLARYFGLGFVISWSIWGTSFLPGPTKVISYIYGDRQRYIYFVRYRCSIVFLFGEWSFWIFISAADWVMILRLWALYKQSKLILGVLLIFYVTECTLFLVGSAMSSIHQSHHDPMVGAVQVLQFSFCVLEYSPFIKLVKATYIIQIAFGTLMCLLNTIKLVREILQMRRMTKQFQLNRYMARLVRDGVTYFMAILPYAVITMLVSEGDLSLDGWKDILAGPLQLIPPFVLVPRFILNLREFYARDQVQGRRGSGIDTAFGLGPALEDGAALGTIVFADVGQDDSGDEDIETEERV